MERNIIRDMVEKHKKEISCGIPSFCTSSPLVIEACLQQGIRFNDSIVIEATANQVNQFGGYTGMRPADFRDMVYQLADKVGFPKSNIVLGGDHLGPLTWCNEEEVSAMKKAEDLVREFVKAGYKKIHLDTSMRLKDDSRDIPLSVETIARRGAKLYRACEEEYQKILKQNPAEVRPVYVIGSEVPIPGGEQKQEDTISITKIEDVEETMHAYQHAFDEIGMHNAMENVVGIVVQPGVEFGDENIACYDRTKTVELRQAVERFPGIVMEGHSTDYQPVYHLREMVNDGFAILKVGPALTYALREGLYALNMIEQALYPEDKQSHFIEILDKVMLENDSHWVKYYDGSEKQKRLKRQYSLSDRSRYYMNDPRVQAAIQTMFHNIDNVRIPVGLLHQYMPIQYMKIREGLMEPRACELVKGRIIDVIEDYNYATKCNYTVNLYRHI